jgi:hypothetical protein
LLHGKTALPCPQKLSSRPKRSEVERPAVCFMEKQLSPAHKNFSISRRFHSLSHTGP